MPTLGDQPCVRSGSKCKMHGGRMIEDALCTVKRSQSRGMMQCIICGTGVERKIARTLNPQLLAFEKHLRRPSVDIAVMPKWLKLLKSISGKDAVCPDCSATLIVSVNGGAGQVPFMGEGSQVIRGVAILIPFIADAKAILQVAQAIMERRKVNFAPKMPHLMLTQCIVAVNAPHACGVWYDWEKMPALTMPDEDGMPGRGHFGFCPWCAVQLPPEIRVRMMVSLKEAIRGMRPGHHNRVVVHPSENLVIDLDPLWEEPVIAVEPGVRDVDCTPCNACETMTGDPSERLEFVPVFEPGNFTNPDECFRALGETSSRYRELTEMHCFEEESSDQGKERAKLCELHGPEARKLGRFRYFVIEHIKERWPEMWRQSKGPVEADTLARKKKREHNQQTRLTRDRKRAERA